MEVTATAQTLLVQMGYWIQILWVVGRAAGQWVVVAASVVVVEGKASAAADGPILLVEPVAEPVVEPEAFGLLVVDVAIPVAVAYIVPWAPI